MDRRAFLKLAGGAAGVTAGAHIAAFAAKPSPDPLQLRIQTARFRIRDAVTENMVSTAPDAPPPVLRVKQGDRFVADVINAMADPTAMHWHGIRVPNKMDGVPYLTQWPIIENETWRYDFTVGDAGTYWYHPHCMTMQQMALGLTGLFIVEEQRDPGFDGETALNLRDFRLGKDGQFLKLYSARKAARGGTLGTVMTANWQQDPAYDHKSGSLVRLRVGATDTTRIYRLSIEGADGKIIAMDGHPVREPVAWPTENAPLVLGAGQRADIALVMPAQEGKTVVLKHHSGMRSRTLATLRSVGQPFKRNLNELAALPSNEVPDVDLGSSELIELLLGWSPDGLKPNNGLCGSLGYTFWSINRKPWPGDAVKDIGPIAELKLGKSYVLRVRNESPNIHPIHLHGLVFRPLRSNQRKLPSNWMDTITLLRNEVVDIGLVADNPGNWALHCHVIEHQKTGLAGYIRVS